VKLYHPEDLSQEVTNLVEQLQTAILFSSLHELEIKNAISLKVYRKEMQEKQAEQIVGDIDSDISSGLLARIHPEWSGVSRRALHISKNITPATGSRTLDILHIAIALEYGCHTFITHDNRQGKAAGITGLQVRFI